MRFKLTDAEHRRWEVPIELFNNSTVDLRDADYDVLIEENPFNFKATRKLDDQLLFELGPKALFQYNDLDIIATILRTYKARIYGLGERVTTSFALPNGTYTIWANGQPDPIDDGVPPGGKQTYGDYPFYLAVSEGGRAHGVFLMNSNAMDVTVSDYAISFRVIGGILDFYIFTGPSPADVIAQFHSILGPPALVPYWSLGWH